MSYETWYDATHLTMIAEDAATARALCCIPSSISRQSYMDRWTTRRIFAAFRGKRYRGAKAGFTLYRKNTGTALRFEPVIKDGRETVEVTAYITQKGAVEFLKFAKSELGCAPLTPQVAAMLVALRSVLTTRSQDPEVSYRWDA